MKSLKLALVFVIVAASFANTAVFAGSKEIKAKMAKRLPVIEQLKTRGIVGENNQGYLQFMGAKKENAEAVNAENADRKAIYSAIAKQQGTTVKLVGQRRAAQIAQIAKKGQFIQNQNGKWQKK